MPDASGFTIADADPPCPRLVPITAHELLTRDFPPRELVLAPWLPCKGLAMLYGPRGIGKTHLTLGCAYAVASGGAFLRWQAPRPRRVLVIDGEMPAATLKDRLARIADGVDREPPEAGFLRLLPMDMQERGLDLADKQHQRDLAPHLDGAELLILDNISTLASGGGAENEAESWTPIQEWALAQKRAGRTVLFIHHAGKGGQQRGTSRREDVLDTVVALRRPGDYQPDQGARFELHFEKSRGFHGDDARPFEAALGARGWTMRDLDDAVQARVMALAADGMSVREIAAELNVPRSTVHRHKTRAEAREQGGAADG